MRTAILIVDDHPSVRVGLRSILADVAKDVQIDEASNVKGALEKLSTDQAYNLILYDWGLPDGGGVAGLLAISQTAPSVPVVVLTAKKDEAFRMAALQMGASGYLLKSEEPAMIRQSVSMILKQTEGHRAAPRAPEILEKARAVKDVASALTARRLQVLRLVAQGLTDKEIGDNLGIKRSTIAEHKSAIFKALQVKTKTQAVIKAAALGLVLLDGPSSNSR